jgi:hypothetical protein
VHGRTHFHPSSWTSEQWTDYAEDVAHCMFNPEERRVAEGQCIRARDHEEVWECGGRDAGSR